ncbi:MAG TPA: serine hydrolase [Firmicutes bacterium]|nr:serine hydrolase [Candidatus Fermentithermobacillaceae bacterium]
MDQPLRATGAFTGYEDELLEILKRAGGEWGIAIEALDGKDSIYLNEEAPLLSASVIKIPIMMAAFHEAREGRIRLDDTYILRSQDKVGGSGVLKELHSGLEITLLDTINLMIVVSDNTATNIVIDTVGKDVINLYMESKGCTGSRLESHLMRPKPRGPWNTITAKDIALLLRGLAERTIENPGDCDSMMAILRRQQINEKLPRYLPREAVCAHKTGEMQGVTHDAGIISGPNVSFVIVCLSQDLEDTRIGVDVIGRTARWAYDILSGR